MNAICPILTPKRLLRSGSLNLKGIFDTCSRFGVLSLFCCPAALINATCCWVAALTTDVFGGGDVTICDCWLNATDDGRIFPAVVDDTAWGNVVWGGIEFWVGGGAPVCPGEPCPTDTSEHSSPFNEKKIFILWNHL